MSTLPSETSRRSVTEMASTLGAQLRSPYRRMQKHLYAGLERKHPDIRSAHSAVFRHISAEGSRLTDLAEQAEMTKQSMAYLVSYLEERGYVKTGKHPDDGRAVLVKLTAKGRGFIDTALAASAMLEKQAVTRMGAANVARLRELLTELDAAFPDSPEE